jgi:hypothetical protein
MIKLAGKILQIIFIPSVFFTTITFSYESLHPLTGAVVGFIISTTVVVIISLTISFSVTFTIATYQALLPIVKIVIIILMICLVIFAIELAFLNELGEITVFLEP